jgi:hypothetical protein
MAADSTKILAGVTFFLSLFGTIFSYVYQLHYLGAYACAFFGVSFFRLGVLMLSTDNNSNLHNNSNNHHNNNPVPIPNNPNGLNNNHNHLNPLNHSNLRPESTNSESVSIVTVSE